MWARRPLVLHVVPHVLLAAHDGPAAMIARSGVPPGVSLDGCASIIGMASYRVRITFQSSDVVWKVNDPYTLLNAAGGHDVQGSPFVITPSVDAESAEEAVAAYEGLVRSHWPNDHVTVEVERQRYRIRVSGPVPAGTTSEAMAMVAGLDTEGFLINSPQWVPGSDGSAWTRVDAVDEADARRRAEEIAARLPGWRVSAVETASD